MVSVARIYRSFPYVLALIAIADLGLGVIRIYLFFAPKSRRDPASIGDFPENVFADEIPSPFSSSLQSRVAFALDWISSIVPTLMGVYLILFALLAIISLCCFCDCVVERVRNRHPKFRKYSSYSAVMCFMCANKANHRFVSLACNCPCYRARPKLRFLVRFGLVGLLILLRTIATVLYATDRTVRVYGQQMALVCGVSLALLLLVMTIDFYHFRVWWYYRPEGIYDPCQMCCEAPDFHPAHRRFLPMPLLGRFRDMREFGDRRCENRGHASCPNRSLEHIAMFHGYHYQPLKRFDPRRDSTYIGFHQTETASATKIAQSGFVVSTKPGLMLGDGIYFARSFGGTEGKAVRKGAYIVAEIVMGKVKFVQRRQLHEVRGRHDWWREFDTVYYRHENENRDEFCIKDPRQIQQWIIVIDDERVYQYGLDREFADTALKFI